MSNPRTAPTVTLNQATLGWDLLAERVQQFIDGWERDRQPPRLTDFLPESPPGLRFQVLVELIKVDLEYQWQWGRTPKRLEEYLREFPELGGPDRVPGDLIYEEFHVRRQAGELVEKQHYFERFPAQAAPLQRLLEFDPPPPRTAVRSSRRLPEFAIGEQLDDFLLLNLLGRGSFAAVYLAQQISMQRRVALKVSANRGTEPQILAQLDHPHIVRIHDQRFDGDRGVRLLYMQYVHGGTLQAVVDAIRTLPAAKRTGQVLLDVIDRVLAARGESASGNSQQRQRLGEMSWPAVVCWLGARLAEALEHAHRLGVLHRDVKPANVLLAADGSPKLADFNISYDSRLKSASAAEYLGGSLPYMSAEQLEACDPAHPRSAEELDPRADLFSLGVLLWELLSGQRPFADEAFHGDWSKQLRQMTQQRRQGIGSLARAKLPADCPPGLEHVLLTCLAANADARYESAARLAQELELCLQPRARALMRPNRSLFRIAIARWSWLVFALAAIIPNGVASLLNIAYNWEEIVKQADPLAQETFRNRQLATVNLLVYSGGIALLIAYASRVCNALRRVETGSVTDRDRLGTAIVRTLWLGDLVAWVSLGGWLLCGIIFPLWMHSAAPRDTFDVARLVHFVASHVICGMIAATLSFFMVTTVAVRYAFPRLASVCADGSGWASALVRLCHRMTWYFGLAVMSPMLAVTFLAVIETQFRLAYLVSGAIGLVTFALPFHLGRIIQHDAAALIAVVRQSATSWQTEGDPRDSFWVEPIAGSQS